MCNHIYCLVREMSKFQFQLKIRPLRIRPVPQPRVHYWFSLVPFAEDVISTRLPQDLPSCNRLPGKAGSKMKRERERKKAGKFIGKLPLKAPFWAKNLIRIHGSGTSNIPFWNNSAKHKIFIVFQKFKNFWMFLA